MRPDPTVARTAALDRLEAAGRGADVSALLGAIVDPIRRRLDGAPGGDDFARFAAAAAPRVDYAAPDLSAMPHEADRRMVYALRQALADLPAAERDDRIDTAFMMIVGAFAAYEARREAGLPYGPADLDTLAKTVAQMITAGLCAPAAPDRPDTFDTPASTTGDLR